MLLRGTSEKYEYLGENETKNQTVLTHWSVAQAGSNDEKNRGRKSHWTVPLTKSVGHTCTLYNDCAIYKSVRGLNVCVQYMLNLY